jgi:hypothetical protein
MRTTPIEFTMGREEIERFIGKARHDMQPGQRFVRGLYAGGTLAYEAIGLLQAKLPKVFVGMLGGATVLVVKSELRNFHATGFDVSASR